MVRPKTRYAVKPQTVITIAMSFCFSPFYEILRPLEDLVHISIVQSFQYQVLFSIRVGDTCVDENHIRMQSEELESL